MKVAVIDYNSGNVLSVLYALERLGVNAKLTGNAEEILAADKVIFPGVGEASTTMAFLRQRNLDALIKTLHQPVLGICLGMQLLCTHSEEGDTNCLGIIPQKVRLFKPNDRIIKVPHIGWNQIENLKGPLFQGLNNKDYVYFVHSYYVEQGPYTIAETNYSLNYSAALQKDNFYATQFHPEKSGPIGSKILQNFINL